VPIEGSTGRDLSVHLASLKIGSYFGISKFYFELFSFFMGFWFESVVG